MSKFTKALAKINTADNTDLKATISYISSSIKDCESNIAFMERNILNHKKELKEAEKKLELEKNKTHSDEHYQSQLDKFFSLPFKSAKVIRTASKNGLLPKIIILTGMTHLRPFEAGTHDDEYFNRFVGRTLGRFLIQYDWSPKRSGYKITIVNLTQRKGQYSSACISAGAPCFGNLTEIAFKLFDQKDIFKLTELILDYLENPVYGSPYISWTDWFNLNSPSTWDFVCSQLFRDYPTNHSPEEEKIIRELIPANELAILDRDVSKDPVLENIVFDGQSTHSNCHCDQCLKLRQRYALFQEFIKNNSSPTLPRYEFSSEFSQILSINHQE